MKYDSFFFVLFSSLFRATTGKVKKKKYEKIQETWMVRIEKKIVFYSDLQFFNVWKNE